MRELPNDVPSRLARLERDNRRLKFVGTGLALALATFSLTSAATSFCKTVWAERLVLQDSSGNDRLTMDAYSSATPSITMKDATGQSVARLSWKDGIAIEMLDATGASKACTRIDRDGKVTTSREGDGECKGAGDTVGMAR